jgi:alpha-1,3-mannosyltransferase
VFTAQVLERIKFRSPNRNECYQGEPSLFCKDMWLEGFDKIAVVPTVNLEYSDETGKRIKDLKGYVSEWVDKEDPRVYIEWEAKPAKKVKCMKNYAEQVWLPWDEGL